MIDKRGYMSKQKFLIGMTLGLFLSFLGGQTVYAKSKNQPAERQIEHIKSMHQNRKLAAKRLKIKYQENLRVHSLNADGKPKGFQSKGYSTHVGTGKGA
jgi:hypothetical protein